jgi:predicted acetyltransferase
LRKYRRQGIGKRAAFDVFDRFPGKWEIRQIQPNVTAQKFWKNVIGEYTKNRFEETCLDNDSWHGPVQSFDNGTDRLL